MSLRKLVAYFAFVLLVLATQSQSDQRYVVLPQSAGKTDSKWLFGDSVRLGTWTPTKPDIDGIEANLSQISNMEPQGWASKVSIEHPERYYRQYIGMTDPQQRKWIYVNAFCEEPPPPDWKTRLIIVVDGGPCFWQAFYDPATQKFSNLMINARA